MECKSGSTVTWNASSPLTDLNQLFASSIGNGHPFPNQRMARDAGLDDSFVQILLRHGAVEGDELEGE